MSITPAPLSASSHLVLALDAAAVAAVQGDSPDAGHIAQLAAQAAQAAEAAYVGVFAAAGADLAAIAGASLTRTDAIDGGVVIAGEAPA